MSALLTIGAGVSSVLLVQLLHRLETRLGLPHFTLVCLALALAGTLAAR